MARHRIGLIVNPVAGLGGSVGLKSSDGDCAARALALGATPQASARAAVALRALQALDLELLTCGGEMGEASATAAGRSPTLVYRAAGALTSGADTQAAARALRDRGIELLLFAGGDGTARDIYAATGDTVPALGVPAGVKMHSAVFATSPRAAGDVARYYLGAADRAAVLREAEVMDREVADDGRSISPALYGFLRTPRVRFLVPSAKASAIPGDEESMTGAADRIAQLAREDIVTVVGPGTTMQAIKRRLGAEGLLGVAIFRKGECLVADATEADILRHIAASRARLVVSVVGGQGFLFGRGNQQLSARVIRAIGQENIIVVAALSKLAALPEGALLVDTGDESLDASLAGFLPVTIGAGRTLIVAVKHVAHEAQQLLAPGAQP